MTYMINTQREKAASWIIGNYEAQLNVLKVTMKQADLIFMHVTLFKEVIEQFINLLCSQYICYCCVGQTWNGTLQQIHLGNFD